MAEEMPILKALRRLITPQFIKPEWIIWTKSKRFYEWEFQPDGFCREHSLTIDFNHSHGGVRVYIQNHLGKEQYFDIPWADPECDTKVVKMLKDWFVML
jgi:hypothetical protein